MISDGLEPITYSMLTKRIQPKKPSLLLNTKRALKFAMFWLGKSLKKKLNFVWVMVHFHTKSTESMI